MVVSQSNETGLHPDQQHLAAFVAWMHELDVVHEHQGKEPPTIDEYLKILPRADRAAWRALMEDYPMRLDSMISIALLPANVITPLEQMYLFLEAASGGDCYAYGHERPAANLGPIDVWLWDCRIALPPLAQRFGIASVTRLMGSHQWEIGYRNPEDEDGTPVQYLALHISPLVIGEMQGGYEAYARRKIADVVMHAAWSEHNLGDYDQHAF